MHIKRWLKKLHNYGIHPNILKSLSTCITQRQQQVFIDGQQSEFISVKSGVLQGTILGPLMFSVYINDISDGISSSMWLFADDSIMHYIKENHDQDVLQTDINQLIKWSKIWQMTFNASKYVVLWYNQLLTTLPHDYTIILALLCNWYLNIPM